MMPFSTVYLLSTDTSHQANLPPKVLSVADKATLLLLPSNQSETRIEIYLFTIHKYLLSKYLYRQETEY